jgi:hypothetical protein
MIEIKKVNLGSESRFQLTINRGINLLYLKNFFYDKCHKTLKHLFFMNYLMMFQSPLFF